MEIRFDLDAELLGMDGIERHLLIISKLHAAGFQFEPLDDFFPATPELTQPYSVRVDGNIVTITQSVPSPASAGPATGIPRPAGASRPRPETDRR